MQADRITFNYFYKNMTTAINYKNELKKFDLRATPARIAAMQSLERIKEPADIKTITDYLRKNEVKIDPATVFRMMNTFTEKGITKQIQLEEGKARYELSSKGDHHHLVCGNCGKIEAIFDNVIPKMEKEIQKKQKFLVKRHSLEFFGLCINCQK